MRLEPNLHRWNCICKNSTFLVRPFNCSLFCLVTAAPLWRVQMPPKQGARGAAGTICRNPRHLPLMHAETYHPFGHGYFRIWSFVYNPCLRLHLSLQTVLSPIRKIRGVPLYSGTVWIVFLMPVWQSAHLAVKEIKFKIIRSISATQILTALGTIPRWVIAAQRGTKELVQTRTELKAG